MSYQKVLLLANKFAENVTNEHFTQKFRALLNEMEGDYLTLRLKGLDRSVLHEFGKLYHNLFEIFKSTIDVNTIPAALTRFVSRNVKDIQKLNNVIQDFLRANQVDFLSGPRLKQAEVQSITKLFELAKTTFPATIEESEEYKPFSGPADKTKA